ncbi:hypothetical protein [Streptomyces sp. DH24]|uniref:hypothetical protein n=1 Tax=Streptomyces sp. DH24 TaxID=3040123 RepID=UPI002442E029|nr:hypothetical protein [Streptomyces sp. DH24]MDG9716275.1 hypothetical protein [Streptomyces sp. DH24]
MAWDEWEQAKATATDGRSAQLRLNQLPADQGAGGTVAGDLVVHQDDLGAVGHDAYVLWDELRTTADIAGAGADKHGTGSTDRAAAALTAHGFAMGAGLARTVEIWTSQTQSVLQACAHISNHLDFTRKLHARDDAKIAAQARAIGGETLSASALGKYFQ